MTIKKDEVLVQNAPRAPISATAPKQAQAPKKKKATTPTPVLLTRFFGILNEVKDTLFSTGQQGLVTAIKSTLGKGSTIQNPKATRNTTKVTAAFAVALTAVTFPVLLPLGVAASAYLAYPVAKLYFRDAKHGHPLNVALLPLLLWTSLIASGALLLASSRLLITNLVVQRRIQLETEGRVRLSNIFGEQPDKAWVLVGGSEMHVALADLRMGDHIIVRAGEVIPVDAIVESGEGQIDARLLTGESQPVEVGPTCPVFATTLLIAGELVLRIDKAGSESLATRIGIILENTQEYRNTLTDRGRAKANKYVGPGLAVASMTGIVMGPAAGIAAVSAIPGISFVECGAVSMMTYLQALSLNKILVKDGRIFESLHGVDTVIFDKTGTLTLDQPTVGTIHTYNGWDEPTVLSLAAIAEGHMDHPIARAIRAHAASMSFDSTSAESVSYEIGRGIQATISGRVVHLGSAAFIERSGIALPDISVPLARAEDFGHGLIFLAIDGQLGGVIELEHTIRPEAEDVIDALKVRGLKIVMISGDRLAATRSLAHQLGIDRFFAEVLPEGKAALIRQLRDEGRFVCYIGDGINDAIAMKESQISISLKGATTAATDTAQIVLMDGSINGILTLFRIADDYEVTLSQNFRLSMGTGATVLGGVLFANVTIVGATVLYFSGIIATLINSLRPLSRYRTKDSEALADKTITNLAIIDKT
jgi:Cu2+-exporting ATPase